MFAWPRIRSRWNFLDPFAADNDALFLWHIAALPTRQSK